MKKFISLLLVLVLVLTSSMAFAAREVSRGDILLDTVALRPLGLAFFVFGCVVYAVSYPAAAITDSTDTTYKRLVQEPYEYTFIRPVGETGSDL
jgi:hypothetical protein